MNRPTSQAAPATEGRGELKEKNILEIFLTGSVFWKLNSSQNLQDQEQREMLNEILMCSLESLTIQLLLRLSVK